MEVSICRTFGDDVVSITKGNSTAVLAKCGDIIVVTNTKVHPKMHPHIALVKNMFGSGTSVQQEFDKILAKLIRKKEDSKYFGKPKWNEHLKNGHANGIASAVIIKIAADALGDVRRYNPY